MTKEEAIRFLGDSVVQAAHRRGEPPEEAAVMFVLAMTALEIDAPTVIGVAERAQAELTEDIES